MPRNLFIYGEPKSGKTSLMKRVIYGVEDKLGFYSEEMVEDQFNSHQMVYDSAGGMFCNSTTKGSDGIFFKDVFSGFIDHLDSLHVDNPIGKETLLYIDEINSDNLTWFKKFHEIIGMYLDLDNPFIATMQNPKGKHVFLTEIAARKDVSLVELVKEESEITYQLARAFLNTSS